MTHSTGRKIPTIEYPIKEVSASRAIYQSGGREIPRCSLTFVTEEGQKLVFEMDHMLLAELIERSMSVYNTIFPPLRTSRGGFGL